MKQILIALVTMISFSAVAQNTNKLIDDYIVVKNALVSGDSKAASDAIETFHQSVKAEGNLAQKDALVKATNVLAKAGGLDKQRAAFNDVSTSLWKAVKSEKVEMSLFYQYCPMKKAYWVSKEKDIKNPYYGSAMLTCGKVVETN